MIDFFVGAEEYLNLDIEKSMEYKYFSDLNLLMKKCKGELKKKNIIKKKIF